MTGVRPQAMAGMDDVSALERGYASSGVEVRCRQMTYKDAIWGQTPGHGRRGPVPKPRRGRCCDWLDPARGAVLEGDLHQVADREDSFHLAAVHDW